MDNARGIHIHVYLKALNLLIFNDIAVKLDKPGLFM